MDKAHMYALEAKHAVLDAQITEELRRPAPDSALVATLKKQKLKIKEELVLH